MSFSPLIRQMIDAFKCLPGIGQKSAQRMALHLLERDRERGRKLAQLILDALDKIKHCQKCRMLTEDILCSFCVDERRDTLVLCVVESPADVFAIEQTHFKGQYFVLNGHLSPLDGIGPEDVGIPMLMLRVDNLKPKEVILAMGSTVEGEATAHFVAQQLRLKNLQITRIAHGIPLGGELDYVDGGTLSHALEGRRPLL